MARASLGMTGAPLLRRQRGRSANGYAWRVEWCTPPGVPGVHHPFGLAARRAYPTRGPPNSRPTQLAAAAIPPPRPALILTKLVSYSPVGDRFPQDQPFVVPGCRLTAAGPLGAGRP
jgi:hypothetical protein